MGNSHVSSPDERDGQAGSLNGAEVSSVDGAFVVPERTSSASSIPTDMMDNSCTSGGSGQELEQGFI